MAHCKHTCEMNFGISSITMYTICDVYCGNIYYIKTDNNLTLVRVTMVKLNINYSVEVHP
jgi:hypothetical protein